MVTLRGDYMKGLSGLRGAAARKNERVGGVGRDGVATFSFLHYRLIYRGGERKGEEEEGGRKLRI